MSVLTLTTPPVSSQLTTLAVVKTEILVTGTEHDAYLTALIAEATETVHEWAGRPLYRAQWTQTTFGNARSTLALSRYPIATIDTVTYDGGAITTVAIQSRGGGLIEYPNATFGSIGEPDEWSFSFTAGWFVSGDDYSGSLSVDATDDSFNAAAGDLHRHLKADDLVYASGFSNTANNGAHRVVSATTSKIVTASSLTTEAAGTRTLGLRNLPGWIERAALELVKLAYHARDRDPALRSLGIGPASFSFDRSTEAAAIRRSVERLAV